MFNLGKGSGGVDYGILIDISSGSVGVAIVESTPEHTLPHLIYTYRIVMRITKYGAQKSENIRRVREALFSASLILAQEGMATLHAHNPRAGISKLYVTCSSPWAHTVARTVRYENDEPFKVTSTIINDLTQSAETEVLDQINHITRNSDDSYVIVERATVDISVNDYPIADPIGKTGTVLALTHTAGLIPHEISETIKELRDKFFPKTDIRLHSYMLIMYCVLRDMFPRTQNMCIIDITGEATEFALVEHGLLTKNISIPAGTNTFIRAVMEELNLPASDIQTSMLEIGEHSNMENANLFAPHIDSYTEEVTDALDTLSQTNMIPDVVVLTAQHPYEQFFMPCIDKAFRESTKRNPTIRSVKNDVIEEISHGAGDDVYLALGARFFHKLHGCGEIDYS